MIWRAIGIALAGLLLGAAASAASAAPVTPAPKTLPAVTAAPNAPAEDCISVDPLAVTATNVAGDWKILDGKNAVLDFGADGQAAQRAIDVIQHYHFTRQCFVRRPNAAMMYWRNGVAIPPGNMAGQDCVTVNPEAVQAQFVGGQWVVVDGKTWVIAYQQDRNAAMEAARIIHTYSLNRECFIARPRVAMQYWLAQ